MPRANHTELVGSAHTCTAIPAQLLMALEQGRNVKARRLNCSPFNQFLQNNTLIITLRDKMGFLYTRLCKLVNLDL